jgi:hypothetical protein
MFSSSADIAKLSFASLELPNKPLSPNAKLTTIPATIIRITTIIASAINVIAWQDTRLFSTFLILFSELPNTVLPTFLHCLFINFFIHRGPENCCP